MFLLYSNSTIMRFYAIKNILFPINRSKVSKAERILSGFGLALFTIGAFFLRFFDPAKINILPACPLLATTGFACPGCGMTRGMHALSQGDFITALDFNALIPLFVLASAYFGIAMFSIMLRGQGLPYRKIVHPGTLAAILFLMIAFGVLRNVPIYPFSVLHP